MNTFKPKFNDKIFETIISKIEEVNASEWENYINFKVTFPKNAVTKKAYRGINIFLLLLCDIFPNARPIAEYATFNQISKRGGKIKKGSKATPVEFVSFQYINIESKEKISKENFYILSEVEKLQYKLLVSKKYFNVFNVCDIENLKDINFDIEIIEEEEDFEFEEILSAEQLIHNLIDNKKLDFRLDNVNSAFYHPSHDFICLPKKHFFINENKYYSTFFHELVHWTGHKNRLNREMSQIKVKYSFEELVAELGCILLCFEFGICDEFINSVRYLKGWLLVQKKEEREDILRNAFTLSKKALRYILN